jgi:hypothetical protein
LEKIRVGIVGTHGLPANYSGWETLVSNLYFGAKTVDYLIATPASRRYIQTKELQRHSLFISLNASGWQSILYDAYSIWKMRSHVDVLLILGVSGCVFLPVLRKAFSGKIITNTDGIEYKREKWGIVASSFLKLSELMAVKYSDALVADNKGIHEYIQKKYNTTAIAIIEYGGIEIEVDENLYRSNYNYEKFSFDLAIARIVPENNILEILEVYSNVNDTLLFIGNWDSSDYGKSIKSKSWPDNIKLLPADYDPRRLSSLRYSSRNYIHGHSAGGTNPSLVEAISLECNIYAFDVNFNRNVLREYGQYWSGKQQLQLLVETGVRSKTREQVKQYYNDNYRWSKIIEAYEDVFASI